MDVYDKPAVFRDRRIQAIDKPPEFLPCSAVYSPLRAGLELPYIHDCLPVFIYVGGFDIECTDHINILDALPCFRLLDREIQIPEFEF